MNDALMGVLVVGIMAGVLFAAGSSLILALAFIRFLINRFW